MTRAVEVLALLLRALAALLTWLAAPLLLGIELLIRASDSLLRWALCRRIAVVDGIVRERPFP